MLCRCTVDQLSDGSVNPLCPHHGQVNRTRRDGAEHKPDDAIAIGKLRGQLADAAAVLRTISQMPGYGLHDGRELVLQAARMAAAKAMEIDAFPGNSEQRERDQ